MPDSSVPAPGQDIPQETMLALRAGLLYAGSQGYPRQEVEECLRLLSEMSVALEAATRERDAAREANDGKANLLLHDALISYGIVWQGRAEAAERSLAEVQQACEKAIRERRSLEIKEDDWHSAYERSQAALETARDALRQIVMAEPNETDSGTAWPSFAGNLQTIAASALDASASTENTP